MEIKKILWPTDFSSNASDALNYVVSLVERYGAEIHVLYVIEDLAHHPDWYGAFNENPYGKSNRSYDAESGKEDRPNLH